MRLLWSRSLAAILLAAAPIAAQAQSYNIQFNSAQIAAEPGQTARVGISLQNGPGSVTGFQFGVRHDATKLTFQTLDIAPALQTALGGAAPDSRFFFVNSTPAGGDGFTVAMILSADRAEVALAPGTHHIFDASYVVGAAATGTASVRVAGDLGNPPVAVVLDLNGTAQAPAGAPVTTEATINVQGGAVVPFRRGDANINRTLDITDALIMIDFLFGGSTLPAGQPARDGCRQIFNFNGTVSAGTPGIEDTADIDVTDVINLLDFLFRRGDPPAAPFPGCGLPASPSAAEIRCTSITCS